MISHRQLVTSGSHNTGASLDVNEQDGTITIKVGTNLDLGIHDLFKSYQACTKFYQKSHRS